jgi:hypothetical protein
LYSAARHRSLAALADPRLGEPVETEGRAVREIAAEVLARAEG